jgi:hypothetical protein
MQKGLDPLKQTLCMKCRKAPSRYYGKWGEEGLCRECIERMPVRMRVRVLRDLHPEDSKRWRLDELTSPRDAGGRPAQAGKRSPTEGS